MTKEQLKDIAQRIAEEVLYSTDYSWVYEDDEVLESELSDEDMQYIHELILNAPVEVI